MLRINENLKNGDLGNFGKFDEVDFELKNCSQHISIYSLSIVAKGSFFELKGGFLGGEDRFLQFIEEY